MATTVLGAAVAQVNASSAVIAALPQGAYADEQPEEITPTPPAVIFGDRQTPPQWVSPTARIEHHGVSCDVYGKAATAAGQDNPAEALATLVEAALDWTNLGLANTTTLGVERTVRTHARETKRAADDERVFRVRIEWIIVLGVG